MLPLADSFFFLIQGLTLNKSTTFQWWKRPSSLTCFLWCLERNGMTLPKLSD